MQDVMIETYLRVTSGLAAIGDRVRDQRGQATAEYVGVILLLVAVIAVLAVSGMATQIGNAIAGAIRAAINEVRDAVTGGE